MSLLDLKIWNSFINTGYIKFFYLLLEKICIGILFLIIYFKHLYKKEIIKNCCPLSEICFLLGYNEKKLIKVTTKQCRP